MINQLIMSVMHKLLIICEFTCILHLSLIYFQTINTAHCLATGVEFVISPYLPSTVYLIRQTVCTTGCDIKEQKVLRAKQ